MARRPAGRSSRRAYTKRAKKTARLNQRPVHLRGGIRL